MIFEIYCLTLPSLEKVKYKFCKQIKDKQILFCCNLLTYYVTSKLVRRKAKNSILVFNFSLSQQIDIIL